MKIVVMILLFAPMFLLGGAFDNSDDWDTSTNSGNAKSYLYYDVNFQDQMKAYQAYLKDKRVQRKQEEDIYISGKRRQSRSKVELKKMAEEERKMNQDKKIDDEEILKLEQEALKKANKK